MRILLFCVSGDGVGLCQQLIQEGHMVTLFLRDKDIAPCYEGLAHKTDDWEAEAMKADFTIFDLNGHGAKADYLRAKGRKVWNGGRLADKLENDRAFGMKVLEKAGVPIPVTHYFKTGKEAQALVESKFKDSDRMVIKLDDPKASKATSYVANDKADMLTRIENWLTTEKDQGDMDAGGIVQEFIEGVEISVEGWFNGKEFLYPYNITMEDKKLLNDDIGPNTGCSQNVIKQLRPAHPKLAKLLLEPLIPTLSKGGYCGQIDVNCIVDDQGKVYALEFTPRAGYDATSTLVMGLPGYGEAISRALGMTDCSDSTTCDCPEGCRCLVCGAERPPFWFLGAVRCWLPPYPFESPEGSVSKGAYECCAGTEIKGWLDGDEKVRGRVVLYDARMEGGKLLTAGTSGIPLIAMGHGPDIDSMREDVYKHLGQVSVANLCYRTDLGVKQAKNWKKIEHLLK